MAMLAEPRRKVRIGPNPRGKFFTEDEDNKGKLMLAKLGWQKGEGLGKQSQGMQAPICPKIQMDGKGLGYDPNNDPWISHNEEFARILENLAAVKSEENQDQSWESTNEKSDQNEDEKQRLEKTSRSSKVRIHYHKFVKSKDVSNFSNQDLKCIFGAPDTQNKRKPVPVPIFIQQVAEQQDSSKVTHVEDDFKTINRGSMADYFKAKMGKLSHLTSEDSKTQTVAEPTGHIDCGSMFDYFKTKMAERRLKQQLLELQSEVCVVTNMLEAAPEESLVETRDVICGHNQLEKSLDTGLDTTMVDANMETTQVVEVNELKTFKKKKRKTKELVIKSCEQASSVENGLGQLPVDATETCPQIETINEGEMKTETMEALKSSLENTEEPLCETLRKKRKKDKVYKKGDEKQEPIECLKTINEGMKTKNMEALKSSLENTEEEPLCETLRKKRKKNKFYKKGDEKQEPVESLQTINEGMKTKNMEALKSSLENTEEEPLCETSRKKRKKNKFYKKRDEKQEPVECLSTVNADTFSSAAEATCEIKKWKKKNRTMVEIDVVAAEESLLKKKKKKSKPHEETVQEDHSTDALLQDNKLHNVLKKKHIKTKKIKLVSTCTEEVLTHTKKKKKVEKLSQQPFNNATVYQNITLSHETNSQSKPKLGSSDKGCDGNSQITKKAKKLKKTQVTTDDIKEINHKFSGSNLSFIPGYAFY